jgi:F0F1-type ATP synthase membrane subunit b/b'
VMFSIFYDIHTYLIISFVATLVILFKFGYSKLNAALDKGVNDVRDLVDGLESKKVKCEEAAETLDSELESARDNASEILHKAEKDARIFLDKSSLSADLEIARKNEELAADVKNVEDGLGAKFAKRCVSAVSSEFYKKISKISKDKDFQNSCFDKSIEMITK